MFAGALLARLRLLPVLRAGADGADRAGDRWCAAAPVAAGRCGGLLGGGAWWWRRSPAAGFWWLDGYHLVVAALLPGHRDAIGRTRYWVWADLAAVVACAGPAAAVVLRRAARALSWRPPAAVLLPLAGAAAILAADLSGLSKAEVERIWLPFAVWLMAGAALLPVDRRRGWLVVQAATALIVNHLLYTVW